MRYTVILTPEPDGSAVNATVPAMPGVFTWGRTSDEALASAREAIELHLESFVERGKPFPADRQPGPGSGKAMRKFDNGHPDWERPHHRVAAVDVSVPEMPARRG